MALRGTGSLHALLGRDITKRRSKRNCDQQQTDDSRAPGGGAASDARRSSSASLSPSQQLAEQPRDRRERGSDASGAAALPPAPTARPHSPLKAGHVRCPVCNVQLPHDDAKVNAHIDKCLSNGALRTRTQQASIFQFAVRVGASQRCAPSLTRQRQHQQQEQQQQHAAQHVQVHECGPTSRGRSSGAAAAAALAAGAAAAAGSILSAAAAASAAIVAGFGDAAEEVDLKQGSDADDRTGNQGEADAASPAGNRSRQEQQAATARPGSKQASRHPQSPVPAQSPSVSWPSQDSPGSSLIPQRVQQHVLPSPPLQRQAQQPQQAQRSPLTLAGRQQLDQRRLSAPLAAPPGSLRRFSCSVVGRQFQRSSVRCGAGQRLELELEPDNPRDANAVMVLDAHSRSTVGHVPHVVARHLGPLLRAFKVVAEAVVLEDPPTDTAPLLVELQVSVQPPAPPSASPGSSARPAAALGRAEAAAATQLQLQPQATGERLHTNFLAVLDTVLQHDAHLLAELETDFIQTYKALPLPGQCLFLRLFLRKGPLFCVGSLAYREVPDAAAAAEQLAAAGLAAVLSADGGELEPAGAEGACSSSGSAAAPADWRQVADLLTVPDLAAVLAVRRIKAAMCGGSSLKNRQQLLAALEAHAARSAAAAAQLAIWLLDATGPVLQLAAPGCEAVCRLQRLFFMDEGKTLSQFLAVDLGGVQYPQYYVQRAHPTFSCRADLLGYEAALVHGEAFRRAHEEEDVVAMEAALQPAWQALDVGLHKKDGDGTPDFLRQFNAGWVYSTMASAGVNLLEKQRKYQEAVERLRQLLGGCCCPERRGEWWERLAINLEHLKRPESALEQSEAALADESLCRGDRLALQRRVLKLGKPPRRWKRPTFYQEAMREPPEVRIVGRPLNSVTGLKSRFYGPNDEQCSVEELALQYYASEEGGGWQGMHSEGGIWATLFSLLMWEVLFMPVPDVFRTPFQTAPLDLRRPSFYPSRKEAADACLARIAAGEAPSMLRRAWELHQGVLCVGVSWGRQGVEKLQQVAECIGGGGLAAVCRLLAEDYAGWQGGMPDLLLWRPARREAKLAEVKGPRDRLSNQQRAWMSALEDAGLRAEVLKVVEPEAAAAGSTRGGGGGGRKRRR